MHILGEMQKVMDKPNPELSDLVPKYVVTFKIDHQIKLVQSYWFRW